MSTPSTDPFNAPLPEVLQKLAEGLLASGTALAIFTPDDGLHYASADFRDIYAVQDGAQTFSSIMRYCFAHKVGPLIEAEDIEPWLAMANAKRRSQANRKFEIDLLDGRWMWASETTFAGGWILLMIADCTFVKAKEFHLRSARDAAIVASETDYLTGLLNRGAMMKRFGDLIESCVVSGEVFSVVLIDLDHFKAINDRFGHQAGDEVLRHFADAARAILRGADLFGRIGGEEFLLIMPRATEDQALKVLKRLQNELRVQTLPTNDVILRYTFSAGVAQWQATKTLDGLYREADQALYAAKHAGRDQVRVA
ncbi:GGDEF domain-containing protein [Asticcacaulis sp. BYS171W]|uniref:diguanylate cyclase n=1 Tax=Asticcacaulis aquaticus TaxID=2984212 RepID=A0ABT5HPB9_9CAUL|nr:GGDEF domain-containing protein [Asticcacaulis aquaticus]MDC7681913.1 GGDEF domain-containing protein [Asticcacaulis aquaticus]